MTKSFAVDNRIARQRQRGRSALTGTAAGLTGMSNDQNLWMRLGEVHESGRTFPRMI
jgi:hypothetical protein